MLESVIPLCLMSLVGYPQYNRFKLQTNHFPIT